MFILFLFAGCSEKPSIPPITEKQSNEVIIYNWEEYSPLELFREFEKETGIKVILKEFETVEEQVSNLQADPLFCDLTIFDAQLIFDRYQPLKLIDTLDPKKLLHKDKFHDHFHKYQEVGIPLSYGVTGFAYDSSKIDGEILDYLFLTDSIYKSKVALLDDNDDFFLTLLTVIGFDYSKRTALTTEFIKPLEVLANKIVQNAPRVGDTFDNLDLLVSQEVLFAQTYSGDFISYQKKHPHIKFIIPSFGLNAWSEIISMSNNAPNKENAYKLLNFLSRPKSAARISNQFNYANGIVGSEKFLNDDIKSNTLINMPEEQKQKSKFYTKSIGHNSLNQKLFTILKKNN
ncbi:MAG: extracellular solute-binding protein [Lentisphaerales bacterium]|nr:extracellular solute-binding protein [Lentisphaerales bacterium]